MSGPLSSQLSSTEPRRSYNGRYCGAVLFDKSGNVIVQSRDQKPGIVNPGMITLFGGGQDENEPSQACIIRELSEELGLKAGPDDLRFLGYVDKVETDDGITRCSIFSVDGIEPDALRLREGRAIAINTAGYFLGSPKVSEVTKISIRAAIEVK